MKQVHKGLFSTKKGIYIYELYTPQWTGENIYEVRVFNTRRVGWVDMADRKFRTKAEAERYIRRTQKLLKDLS